MFGGSCQRGIRVLGIIKKEGGSWSLFGVSVCLCERKRRHEMIVGNQFEITKMMEIVYKRLAKSLNAMIASLFSFTFYHK